MFHIIRFERGGVQFEGMIPGTSQQDSSGMKSLIIKSMFRRAHRELKCTYTPGLCSPEQHDRDEARNCKKASG